MKKTILITLTALFAMITRAQNLSQMSEIERNKKLIQTAKEAVKNYAPDYYKYTNGAYTIKFIDNDQYATKPYYRIEFKDYNTNEEYFKYGFAVVVEILSDNCIAECVGNGHGIGIGIPDKPLTRGEKPRILEYKRREPPKPVQRPDGKMMYRM